MIPSSQLDSLVGAFQHFRMRARRENPEAYATNRHTKSGVDCEELSPDSCPYPHANTSSEQDAAKKARTASLLLIFRECLRPPF